MTLSAQEAHADALIPPYALRGLLRQLQGAGHDIEALCRGTGYTAEDLLLSEVRLSFRQSVRLLKRGLRCAPDPCMGLRVGASQRLVSWGLIGFGIMACGTLGEALAFGLRYQVAAASALALASFTSTFGAGMVVRAPGLDPEVERFLVEEAFASHLAVARQLLGEGFVPQQVAFKHPAPPDLQQHHRHYACPVLFGQPEHRMLIRLDDLEAPIAGFDPAVRAEAHALVASRFGAVPSKHDWEESVAHLLRQRLADLPSLAQVAADLNVSERSLRRHLSERHTSYRQVVEGVRWAAYQRLRALDTMGLQAMASELGFADFRGLKRFLRRVRSRPSGAPPDAVRDNPAHEDDQTA